MSDPSRPPIQNGLTTRQYLNALRQDRDAALENPPRGAWKASDRFLDGYAASVDVDVQLLRTDMTHSVPSVFQRPMQFYWALQNPTNPLHDVVTGEWRGLLAALALNNWMRLQIAAQEFPPFEEKKAGDNENKAPARSFVGNQTTGDLHFRTILQNQLPMRLVPGDPQRNEKPHRVSDWEKWWIIRCGNSERNSIGATSPWTLVYTAASYKSPATIPWQRDGILIDPIDYYDPRHDRSEKPLTLGMLYAWVLQVLGAQASWAIPGYLGTQETVIVQALKQWRDALEYYVRPELMPAEQPADPHATAAPRLGNSIFPQAPLKNILRPIIGPADDTSEYFLTNSAGASRLLILSEKIPGDRPIYGGTPAARINIGNLPPKGDLTFKTTDEQVRTCPYVVAEKVFFPDKLVRLTLSDDAYRAGPENISLPLTPEYIRLFGFPKPENLSVQNLGDTITVKLNLPLSGTVLHVEKSWKLSNDPQESGVQTLEKGTPAFALWPNKFDPQWKNNSFAAYSAPEVERGALRVRPLFLNGELAPPNQTACNHCNQKETRIWTCQQPAIGFAVYLGQDDAAAVPAGLLLRRNLDEPPPPTSKKTWNIGVDFGTSSTTVMRKAGTAKDPEPMPFGGRTLFLTRSDDKRVDYFDNISYNLYPSEARTPPFLTLLYRSAANVFGNQVSQYTLRFDSSLATLGIGEAVPDVKWSGELNEYLRALVRYIVWEARLAEVETLNFHWSYPLSLTPRSYNMMVKFWKKLGQESPPEGMTVSAQDGMSESEAICRALCRDDDSQDVIAIHSGSLIIAVDVGGGSTDVALWSDRKLLDQFSFKLAGNNILNSQEPSKKALTELFSACYGNAGPANLDIVQKNPKLYLNGAMTEALDSDGKVFRDIDPRKHPIPRYILGSREETFPWLEYRTMIYLFFTGVCYYLGLCARRRSVAQPEIEIYFGGRGSSFLTWLDSSGPNLARLLEYAFRIGLGSTHVNDANDGPGFKNRNVQFLGLPFGFNSKYPSLKSEVVTGLLRSKTTKLDVPTAHDRPADEESASAAGDSCPAGEVHWKLRSTGQSLAWDYPLKPNDWADLEAPTDSEFQSTAIGEFKSEMLQASNPKVQNFMDLHAIDIDRLNELRLNQSRIRNLVARAALRVPDGGSGPAVNPERSTQPIFAYELESLMNQYAELVGSETNKDASH